MIQDKYGGMASGPIETRLWLRLLSCVTLIEKRLRRNLSEHYNTTLPRFDVMATLDRRPDGQTMGELSRALLVSNGNVTAIVRQLVEQGLAVSTPVPEDRRSSIVALSEAGKTQFDELAKSHHRWIKEALADFPKDKQTLLYDLLVDLKISIIRD